MSPKTDNNSDGFEEIEYSASSSNSSSSPSPLSRPGDNQDASNQTDQNDANKQPTELVYQLDFETRDEIIFSLNRYTRVIYGENAETSEKLMNENTDLYQALIGLPMKSRSNAPTGSGPSKVVLGLDSSTRLQIVNTLMANQSLIVGRDSTSEESKMQLAEQNSKLIASLATLPVRVIAGSASATVSDDHGNRSTKRAELVGELTKLNEIVEEQTAKNSELARKNEELATKNEVLTKTVEGQAAKNSELTSKNKEQATKNSELTKTIEEQAIKNSELTKTIEVQATQIFSLGREVAVCQKEIKRIKEAGDLSEVVKMLDGKLDLGTNKKKAEFEYKLDGVGAFLESKEKRLSKFFLAGGLAWNLEFQTKVEGEERFLSIYLRGTSYTDCRMWSIKATQTVIVLNQSGSPNHSLQCTKDFTTFGPAWGYAKFISANELRTGGFIKNNKIKIRVHLKVAQLVLTH